MTTIAIAMATHNGETYLAQQLASLAEQTHYPAELVVVDDASSDGTLQVLDGFSRQAPFPVRLHKNVQRLGYREGFIKAADLCSADVIAFCDQDDIWSRLKIQMLQRAFDENPETLLVYHNSTIVNETGTSLTTTFSRTTPSHTTERLELSPCLVIPGHAQAFRRSLNVFSALHPYSIDPYAPRKLMPHDMWMPFWASSLGHVQYLSDTLVNYRIHSGNASGWHVTWRSFAADHIRSAWMYIRANETIASNREELLGRAQHLLEQTQFPALDPALDSYKKFKAKASQRASVYTKTSIFSRARALLAFTARGNYRWGSRCHGIQAFLLDLAVGVFGGWLRPRT